MGQCGSSNNSKNQKDYTAELPKSNSSQAVQYDTAIHQSSVLGIASFEGSIASCGDDNTIVLCNVNRLVNNDQSIPPQVLKSHEKAVNRVLFHNRCLFSASRDLSLRMWSGEAFDNQLTIRNAHGLNIAAISAVSSRPGLLYSGSRDYSVKVWDLAMAVSISEYSCPRNIVTSLCTSEQDSDLLYQGAEDLNVRVWDTRLSHAAVPAHVLTGYVYFPLCMSRQQSGYLLATGTKGFNGVGCGVMIWDMRQIAKPLIEHKGHAQDVTGISFSHAFNEQVVMTCSKDGTILAWDMNNGLLDMCQHTSNKIFSCLSHVDITSDNSERYVVGAMDGAIDILSLSKDSQGEFEIKQILGTKPVLLD